MIYTRLKTIVFKVLLIKFPKYLISVISNQLYISEWMKRNLR